MFHILGQLLSGLVVGMIAQMLVIGNDPGGWSIRGIGITALIGMGGSFIGSVIGRFIWGSEKYAAGWIMSILGAVLLLLFVRWMF